MTIVLIASYLVHPGKSEDAPPDAIGTLVPLSGSLYRTLNDAYGKARLECGIPICFVMAPDGSQNNEVRDLVLSFIRAPTLDAGKALANRLRDQTTRKSGLGLLFLILGQYNGSHRLLLSRFPADQGILAEARRGGLQVKFIERIFMKSSTTYKAALYEGESPSADFWSGFAVDKQTSASSAQIANYWIKRFLLSDFKTTSKAGTMRLAVALREASKRALGIETKQQIVAAAKLIPGLANSTVSVQDIMQRYSLSPDARAAIEAEIPRGELRADVFVLDKDEFLRHASYASVELDNGAMLLAASDRFDECFEREPIGLDGNRFRFTTSGRIMDERVRGRR